MNDTGTGKATAGTGRALFIGLVILCTVLLAADALYHRHAKFAVEGWFGFYAVYAFAASVLIAAVARLIRRAVMRREDYYGDDDV